MRVWIDADGCPVVSIAIEVAKKYALPVTVVKNYAISIQSEYAEIITVDISKDSADYYIANHLAEGDLVITQDNGLAAMVLAKKGFCLNQNGREINSSNIDFVLDSRHLGRVARQQNIRGPRHKKRTGADDAIFRNALIAFLSNFE